MYSQEHRSPMQPNTFPFNQPISYHPNSARPSSHTETEMLFRTAPSPSIMGPAQGLSSGPFTRLIEATSTRTTNTTIASPANSTTNDHDSISHAHHTVDSVNKPFPKLLAGKLGWTINQIFDSPTSVPGALVTSAEHTLMQSHMAMLNVAKESQCSLERSVKKEKASFAKNT